MSTVSNIDFGHIRMTQMQRGTFMVAKIGVIIILYKSNIYSLQQVHGISLVVN